MNTRTHKIIFGLICAFICVGVSEATVNPPHASINPSSNQTVTVGQTISFDGNGSYDPDPGQTIVAYAWTFPPQAVMIKSYDSSETYCKFNTAGSYAVSLKVQDNTGRWSTNTASCSVTVTGTSSTWYVSPNGNDGANNGQSRDTAFHRIQTAIDCASSGNVVEVSEGIYYETINFRGKNITVKSNPENPTARANTIIDGSGAGTVVSFTGMENTSAVLEGITVRGGGSDAEQLIAHWPFDSNAEDAKGNHDGAFNDNATWTTAVGQHIVGDGALSLDGTEDFVSISGYKGITGRQARTCAAWIKTSTISANNVDILYWGDNTPAGAQWRMCLSPNANNTQAYLRVEVGGSGYKLGSVDVAHGPWHHIAVTWSNDGTPDIADAQLYVDGQLDTGGSSSGYQLNTGNNSNVWIGRSSQNKDFSGLMDDVRIYARALAADEIKALITTTRNPFGAHWKLDDNPGSTAADSSGNGRDGTLQGNMNSSDWVTGLFGNSLDLDGTDDYVVATGYTGISGTNARTTAAWIKTTDVVGPIMYWGKKDGTGELWDMRVSSTGKLRVVAGGPAVDGSTTINTGQWVHVAAVLPEGGNNTTNILLYVNGVLETGTTVTAGTINTIMSANVRIGANETGHYYMGQIDDVRIYSSALTGDEIKILSRLPGPETYWKLDETTGPTAPDSGPDGRNGTLQGFNNPDQERWIKGVFGNSLNFDGNDDYVTVTGYKGISGSKARTCAAWVKLNTGSHDKPAYDICNWGTSAAGNVWRFKVQQYGTSPNNYYALRVEVSGGNINGSIRIPNQQWVHVAAVLPDGKSDVKDVLFYVNGVCERPNDITYTAYTINTGTSLDVRIGSYAGSPAHYYRGQMDDLRIYRRALSGQEIVALAGGGGIHGSGTQATISQCVIENNQSLLPGGGIWNVDGTISRCLIRGNTAVEGGGLADCGTGTVDGSSILNCIVAENSAQSGGGGLANCTAKIRNCTIVDNDDGLLNCAGSIVNCILWNNGDDLANSPNVSYSCVEDNDSGNGNIHVDPHLDDSYRLQVPSGCINRGDSTGVLTGELDYIGSPRIFSGTVDIGAVEYQLVNTHNAGNGLFDYGTIQEAIEAARDGEIVVVKRGVWTGGNAPDINRNRDLTFGGKRITVQSEDPTDPKVVAATVIDCQGTNDTGNRHRAFLFNTNETNESVVDGLTIINGYGPWETFFGWENESTGGAIFCYGGLNNRPSPTIRNCVFRNNEAGFWGGAIYLTQSEARIINCTFENNKSGGTGGGVYAIVGSPTIQDCVFKGNSAYFSGGGIRAQGCNGLHLSKCRFERNFAWNGGAIVLQPDQYQVTDTVITDCQFHGNVAFDQNLNDSKLGGTGGAVRIQWDTAHSDVSGSLILMNCEFAGNWANQFGGAIYTIGNETKTNIIHCTIAGNHAVMGGGIVTSNGESLNVTNSILWGNRDEASPEDIQAAQVQGTLIENHQIFDTVA